jgi:hypothetical protein
MLKISFDENFPENTRALPLALIVEEKITTMVCALQSLFQ